MRTWVLGAGFLIGVLAFPNPASARFLIAGDQIRGVNLVATVSVEGGIEDTQGRSRAPLFADLTPPFATDLDLTASVAGFGSTETAGRHGSSFTETASGDTFYATAHGQSEVRTAISDPGSASFSEGLSDSFYELNFDVQEESRPFHLRVRLLSELSDLAGAGSSELAPRARIFLREADTETDLLEITLVDAIVDGVALEQERRFTGDLPPGPYRFLAEAVVEGVAREEATGTGFASYDVTLTVPEPDASPTLGVLGMALASLAGNATRRRGSRTEKRSETC